MSNSVKLTKALLTNVLSALFNPSGGSVFGTGNTTPTILRVYKGTPPLASDVTAMTQAYLTGRASDLLIEFNMKGLYDSVTNNTARLKNTDYSTAAASGDATWFVLYTNTGTTNSSLQKAIVGSVTDMNGNGDLKLLSISMVSGQQYRVQALNFAIPFQFTY